MSHQARIKSALWMIPLAVLSILYLPTPYMGAVMALLLLAGLHEWAKLAHIQHKTFTLYYLLANASVMAAIAWLDTQSHTLLYTAVLIGGIFWLLALLWLWKFNFAKENTAQNNTLKLVAGSLACIPAWAGLVLIHGSSNGPAWTLLAVGLIAAADSGAYLFGVNFGKHKLAPNISPGKSWEGFWGGLFCSIGLAIGSSFYFEQNSQRIFEFALLGLVIGVFSVIGDLFESMLKRHAQIKDSSSLIPGHGGLLDRLDSILSGLTVFALLKFWLQL
jgi:phosphatidate cytidylyltransferase